MKIEKKIFTTVTVFFVFLFVYCFMIYFFQNKFLFDPDTNYKSPQDVGTPYFIEKPIIAKDGTKIMTWFFEGSKNKPLILFFHGNTGQLSCFSPLMLNFVKQGYSVAMIEYRGFGNTKGQTRQEKIFSDATTFYDKYKSNVGNGKIIFYGYSFGCAVVMGLTQYRVPDAIILTSPFSSFYQEVKDHPYPFAHYLLKDKYHSDEYAKNINVPILIIHSNDDKLIKVEHSKNLYNIIPSKYKKLCLVDGISHHDIFFKGKNIQIIQNWLKNF